MQNAMVSSRVVVVVVFLLYSMLNDKHRKADNCGNARTTRAIDLFPQCHRRVRRSQLGVSCKF